MDFSSGGDDDLQWGIRGNNTPLPQQRAGGSCAIFMGDTRKGDNFSSGGEMTSSGAIAALPPHTLNIRPEALTKLYTSTKAQQLVECLGWKGLRCPPIRIPMTLQEFELLPLYF